MKILSVNAGSSSLKFQLYEMPEETVLVSGVFERIGIEGGKYTLKINGEKINKNVELKDHSVAVSILTKELLDNNIIASLDEIKGVGHRVVHGGDKYASSVLVTEEVIKEIEELSALAPLHNPANLIGIRSFMETIPSAKEVCCFDTAFHQTMKLEQYLYALPYEWNEQYGIRKYGFHGMSHKYVSNRISELSNGKFNKIVVCHLGNGGSISAVENLKCVNTTMGFTPNAGIVMGTRSGDIDYSVIPYIMKKTGMTIEEVDNTLNKKSGVLGVSGVSSDFRDVEEEILKGNTRAKLAETLYVNSVVSYVAKYYVELNGIDAICFTAGVGENSTVIRKLIMEKLSILGIKIDNELNDSTKFGKEGIITTENSSIPCYVVPTDEEVMIARDTLELI